jgi:hypothetical protein
VRPAVRDDVRPGTDTGAPGYADARTCPYRAGLGTVLRSTAASYGYTLTTAATVTQLVTVHGAPGIGKLFLFVVGGLIAYAAIEVLLLTIPVAVVGPPGQLVPFAGALNLVSVTAAFGAATVITHALLPWLAWLLSPMAATAVYLLLVAGQVTVLHSVRG